MATSDEVSASETAANFYVRLYEVTENLRWLFTSKTHADCRLLVGPEKVVIEAHKAVISVSPFFRSALQPGRFKEGFEDTVELPEDQPEDIKRVLAYIYTGTYAPNKTKEANTWLDTFEKNFIHLRVFALGDRLLLPSLRNEAVRRIKTSMPEIGVWPCSLVPFVCHVYNSTTPIHKELRDITMEWVLGSLSHRGLSMNVNPDAIVEFIAIPDFGDQLAKLIFNGYLESKGKKPVYSVQ